MLYKKYHRNFVKQFKRGAKFIWWMSDFHVNSNPFIENGIWWIKISARIISSRVHLETLEIVLVDIYGKIASEYNALQKIS